MEKLQRISLFFSKFVEWICLGMVVSGALVFLSLYIEGIPSLNPYIILSGSMTPEIPVGAVVLVKPQALYTPGDIITFSETGKKNAFVTHRIINVERSNTYYGAASYTTKGDANKTSDVVKIPEQNVKGKVVLIVPYIGYVVNFIKTPKGFLLFIVIPATIIVYEELKNIKKELWKFLQTVPTNHTTKTFPLVILILPLLTSISLAVLHSGSFLKDAEESIGSVIGASSSYAKPSEATSSAELQ